MLKILKKDITKKEAIEIEDKMLILFAYDVSVVECDDDTYMVVGNEEELETYNDNYYRW